jgi:hypothetical protein
MSFIAYKPAQGFLPGLSLTKRSPRTRNVQIQPKIVFRTSNRWTLVTCVICFAVVIMYNPMEF